MNKAILIALLLTLSFAYTEDSNVLVLTDDDVPGVLTEFTHILVELYAPWCGHCKSLEPIYKEVATELKAQGSVVRLAKIDATEQKKAAEHFEVSGFPTLYFFINGVKMDYNGPRSKDGMIGWINKRIRDPVSEINAETYANLAQEKSVYIVYHGDFSAASSAEAIKKLAIVDDYNTFYWGKGLGKEDGTIEILRSFGEPVTTIDTENLASWIAKHDKPTVVDFNERAINEIFSQGIKGLVLFNGESSEDLLSAFKSAADEYDGSETIIFTEVSAKNEHLENFANYIKIDRKAFPVVLIQAKDKLKYVLKQEATKENILSFLADYSSSKYGITDEVKS